MAVDTGLALRVLAHELRSPVGVAQGYVRMLLDGRLSDPADQRRVLEQIRDVLGRIGQLSRQASEAANWLDHLDGAPRQRIDARSVIDHAIAAVQRAHDLESVYDFSAGTGSLTTTDRQALATAIASLLEATARERPGYATRVRVQTIGTPFQLELLAGDGEEMSRLALGPQGPAATPIVVERGGLGLALVTASLVLETHGAATWTIDSERGFCGIRMPLEI